MLNLHPWLTGQASRVHHMDEMLADVVAFDSIWAATGFQIGSGTRLLLDPRR